MLSYFRKIRRSLIDSGRLSKYFLYAIGEILLVMIGILLALQVNNWNEQRKLRKIEKETLIDIRDDIKTTLDDINQDSALHKISLDATLEIMDFINSDQEWYDSLAMAFELAYYEFQISSIETAYRSLESKGVELISNKELRQQISSFYDYDIPWLRRVETGNGRFYDLLIDYYTQHFTINENPNIKSLRDIDEAKLTRHILPRGFIPLDTQALKSDPRFKVLLREVIYERNNIFGAYKMAGQNALSVIESINEEIGK
jgi:hypothetical protein